MVDLLSQQLYIKAPKYKLALSHLWLEFLGTAQAPKAVMAWDLNMQLIIHFPSTTLI